MRLNMQEMHEYGRPTLKPYSSETSRRSFAFQLHEVVALKILSQLKRLIRNGCPSISRGSALSLCSATHGETRQRCMHLWRARHRARRERGGDGVKRVG
eukprot:6202145-Pleurochrysis_carterae.AAC.3